MQLTLTPQAMTWFTGEQLRPVLRLWVSTLVAHGREQARMVPVQCLHLQPFSVRHNPVEELPANVVRLFN